MHPDVSPVLRTRISYVCERDSSKITPCNFQLRDSNRRTHSLIPLENHWKINARTQVRAHIAEWFRGAEKYVCVSQARELYRTKSTTTGTRERHNSQNVSRNGLSVLSPYLQRRRCILLSIFIRSEITLLNDWSKRGERRRIQNVSFDSVVSGQVDFEVCRSFLAMLQLANNGNLHSQSHH